MKGERIESRSRFAIIRMDNGQADVVFYPALKSSPLERYDEAQQKQLLAGKAIIADVEMADGRSSKAFVQIDTGTKTSDVCPHAHYRTQPEGAGRGYALGAVEINGMQHGEPLTVVVDDEPATVGIDLHAKTGIRFCSGDAQHGATSPSASGTSTPSVVMAAG